MIGDNNPLHDPLVWMGGIVLLATLGMLPFAIIDCRHNEAVQAACETACKPYVSRLLEADQCYCLQEDGSYRPVPLPVEATK